MKNKVVEALLPIGDHIHHTLEDALKIYVEPLYMLFPELIGVKNTQMTNDLKLNAKIFGETISSLA